MNAVAVTADGRLAVSGSEDGTVKVWDVESGSERATLAGHTGWVNAVAVTADGRLAVSGSGDRTVRIWDLERGACLAVFSAEHPVLSCAVAGDGATVVAGDRSGHVHRLRLVGWP